MKIYIGEKYSRASMTYFLFKRLVPDAPEEKLMEIIKKVSGFKDYENWHDTEGQNIEAII